MGSITPATEPPAVQTSPKRRLSQTDFLEDEKSPTSTYDVLIVGGGISGLSAAATIVRQDHSVLILDSQKYRNAGSPHMHTVATWDHRNPADWRAAARKDFDRYGTVTLEYDNVDKISKTDNDIFVATSASGKSWSAKKVILATGVEDVFPAIPGYAENWITGIFHCLYCHGWEEKGAESSGVFAEGEAAAVLPALHFARQALRISKSVTIYTHGNTQLAEDIETALNGSSAPMKVDSRKIVKLEKPGKRSGVIIHTEDGSSKVEGFLAHKPKSRLRGSLHEQLGLDLGPKGTIASKPPFGQSNVKGLFVAGDMSTPMQTVTMAQATGTSAGAGAPLQLQAEMWNQTPIF
ncbi:hypothetical protein SLS60_004313 [Paraconiothyrium brasiliense]|uniref:FAD/NAD(P)-binding domain-containing protein n=1 Tax=Paraconiothyrium brasiliense TaxID=300254 RepID=A0ABR3RKG3_9PLEO